MIKKIILIVLGVIIVSAIGIFGYIQLSWNKTYHVPYPDLKISQDSAVIERGRYLVHGPAHCSNCHVSSFKEMILADKGEDIPLYGGVEFLLGPIGKIHPANLTPDEETGIGRYSDGQIFRMMRHAVKPDGTASLSLIMPFFNMADDDLIAIVSYLRSRPPVKNKVTENQWTFMGKVVRTFAPPFRPVLDNNPPKTAPPMEPTVERGEYIAKYVANCIGCHTEFDPQTFEVIGPEFAGGNEFEPFPELHREMNQDIDLWTRSPNITPHPNSAFAQFKTLDQWIARFRNGRIIPVSPMHWGPFSRMSDEDLEALYLYLNSLEPVENDVGPTIFKKEPQ